MEIWKISGQTTTENNCHAHGQPTDSLPWWSTDVKGATNQPTDSFVGST